MGLAGAARPNVKACLLIPYSHSMVAGGFDEMS